MSLKMLWSFKHIMNTNTLNLLDFFNIFTSVNINQFCHLIESMATNSSYFSDISCVSAVPYSDHHSSAGHIRVQRRHSNVFENFTLQRPDTDTKV